MKFTKKQTKLMELKRALCLDMDGTIRKSKTGTFVTGPDDIELMPGIEKAIWRYRDFGYLIIIVSNQGGVAHGFKTPKQVHDELDATIELFEFNPFHIVKQCYHMEGGTVEPYCHRSILRKPDTGMLALAENEAFRYGFIIDWDNSLMVGDREEDRKLAANARIAFQHIDDFLNKPQTIVV